MRISDWSSDVCSSDLWWGLRWSWMAPRVDWTVPPYAAATRASCRFRHQTIGTWLACWPRLASQAVGVSPRSEEHTSELQSLMRISYAVFCLKKKNINYITITATKLVSTLRQ